MTDKVTSGRLVVLGLVGLQIGLWAALRHGRQPPNRRSPLGLAHR